MLKHIQYTSALLFAGLLSVSAWAQQDPQLTHQLYNPNLINPAYVGSDAKTTLSGAYRAQWLGMDGAPQTGFISLQHAMPNKHFGLGLNLLSEIIGPMKSTDIQIDGAYTLVFQNGHQLAAGLKVGLQQRALDFSEIGQFNPNDPMFAAGLSSSMQAQVGTGLFYYTPKAYVGLSVPAILEHSQEVNNQLYTYQQRHFYLSSGYVFHMSPKLLFKPTLLAKWTAGAPLSVDLTANLLIDRQFTLGLAYRHSAALSALFGVDLKNRLFIAYAYDFDINGLQRYSFGSHEIFIKFNLKRSPSSVLSPRFF